ncbi:alpha-2-macroglobulin family protein [Acidovorax lacteus]|uniref:MG2 domain-containing protein n=1 Tax=Acidovorax lacteus TaxID=1924988 RepID=A0ABP8LFT6_9BURK
MTTRAHSVLAAAAAWGMLLAAPAAQALQISSLSPQGEVAQVRQVVVKFDTAATTFGDARAPAPVAVQCSDAQASQGSGRWTSEREWVFDFANDLPPGVRCTVAARAGFQSPAGEALRGTTSFRFQTGGPFVRQILPGSWTPIEEEQFFLLQLNGPATAESVQANVWCTLQGVGERIPVRLIDGPQRKELLRAQGLEALAAKEPLALHALACNRRLTSGAQMHLVYGKGVTTPSGLANSVERRTTYKVREAFAAEFACERENAQSACLPIRPLQLSFNAPVPRKLAQAVRLQGGGQSFKPQLEGDPEPGSSGKPADPEGLVHSLQFKAPLPQDTAFTIELPKDFKDASGRSLRNAGSFPLRVSTAGMPPLAKFAAAPFGIVERLAEGPGGPALLPVTLRNVEAALRVQGLAPVNGQVRTLQPGSDAEIIAWWYRVQRFDRFTLPRRDVQREVQGPLPKRLPDDESGDVQTRMVSLLAGRPGVAALTLPEPAKGDGKAGAGGEAMRPFEVVGIPLPPGFHVVEIASPRLGLSLLDERHGAPRTMYVRTSALVTNLGVHFKLGRENALAWVTTLDKGQPVSGAQVRVSDCSGKELATARTDAQGVARIEGLSPDPQRCGYGGEGSGYFVSARAAGPDGVQDLAFTWSDWQRGIEPWRFNLPTSSDPAPDERAHTVMDRMLLRAGETVSMKHVLRTETGRGLGLPTARPESLVITHVGSGQQFTQPLVWRSTASGGLSAHSEFAIPPAARLGEYTVQLQRSARPERFFDTGRFRVEEFRLPVLEGRIAPQQKQPLVRPKAVPTEVQVHYVSGGPAAQLPVRISALVRGKALGFADHEGVSFQPPRAPGQPGSGAGDNEEAAAGDESKLVADKLPLQLDRQGQGRITIENLPVVRQPRELVLEAAYADPNGEMQTLRSVHTLWPAQVVAGIKADGWASARQKVRFQALALQHSGKPAPEVALKVKAVARITTTARKRMVGGFYSYDHHTETRDLGVVCSGRSDARGLMLCEASLKEAGEVELVATATDRDGNTSEAATTVWVTRQGELWFGGEDHDRIDVLPEKKQYRAGEVARLQVRMPFRQATALVAVEREGILETQVVTLQGDDPTVQVKVQPEWGPNVYVSVLALRGRLREVPWYSFFTWGVRAPREWWNAFWYEGREYVAPTPLVDLSKPAYRLGVAEIRVGTEAHRLDVQVQADRESYPVRGKAQVTITARLPDGQPAAGAEVAVAVVDEALLELMPNTSWDLLDAMLQRRSWGVQTATAQMEIIGRRHYGRKAVPAGGGGGRGGTRELLDTLLLWQPAVSLDAKGQARVVVPLNDALTRFRVVAVADSGAARFGTGTASIRTTQDLQIISGLPPLVREDDRFRAQITLRNTTAAAMKVQVSPRATLLELPAQTIELPAGESREVAWDVTAPAQLAFTRAEALLWEIEARDTLGGARDALKLRQRIVPAVPLSVQQGTLVQLDGPLSLDVKAPADALPGRGGVRVALQPRLAEGLPGVRDWWARYPFACLEQKASKSIGLRDAALWQGVAAQLPTYLDADGLASYFPPRAGEGNRGSDTLTAYLLAATHEASQINPAFALPDAARAAMEQGLTAFVEGRIQREVWSPRKDLDLRKLAAIEALSRYGRAQPRLLQSITIAPQQWPTHALIDWLQILRRMPDLADRDKRLAEVQQTLRARLSFQGTRLVFSTERDDYWWWLMQSGDVNSARLLLAVMDDPAWKDDLGRMASGFIARQQGGAWHTTTANLWGGLALERFSARFESAPVTGSTRATLAGQAAAVDWARVERVKTTDAAGAPHQTTAFGAPAAVGMLRNNSVLLPWPAQPVAEPLVVTHQGTGRPWATLQSLAAVPLKAPFAAGYTVRKTVTPVDGPAAPAGGPYARGEVLRVTLEIAATTDMSWVAVTDPIPAGATILGSGLGRDSEIATRGERKEGSGWLAFEERSFEAFRGYYEYLPRGTTRLEYTVRLNNVGEFALPPTRAEAMYAPEVYGETPNPRVRVVPAR